MADRRILSDINVTPFVDVMLVLLVIFMVTAPMMESGIDVNLPKVEAAPVEGRQEPLIVTIDGKGRVFVNKLRLGFDELEGKLRAVLKRRTDRVVYLRADASVPYGQVARTMAAIRNSGVERIAMITEPPEEAGR